MRIVVTGGAGFIGANLCRAISETGAHSVVAFDNLSTGFASNVVDVPGVELVVGDILDPVELATAFRGAHAIVHLAARPSVPRSLSNPVASHLANATGTVYVLEAARAASAEHVIIASSSSVYGANPVLPKSELLTPAPVSPYGASKLAAETYALAWQRSFGLPTLAFRFFNVFGPLQAAGHAYAAVVPTFVSAAMAGTPLPIHGDGGQTRDFTFVGSVVGVLLDAIEREVSYPEPVNLAFGTRSSLLNVVEELEKILGKTLERHHQDVRAGDVRDSQADGNRLASLFPDVKRVDLVEGLTQTVRWFETFSQPSAAQVHS